MTDDARPSKPVSGVQLCTALNRADLPTLLGTPTEYAMSASGNESVSSWADGTKTVTPEAEVELSTYSVKLSTSDDVPVAELASFLGTKAESRKIGGHPAVLYSDRTIALKFNLGGGKVDTGPGGIARSLLVAKDIKDGGGSYEISIWRQDDVVPDDLALLRVAETVLPEGPGLGRRLTGHARPMTLVNVTGSSSKPCTPEWNDQLSDVSRTNSPTVAAVAPRTSPKSPSSRTV